jgi:hypothetical protein
MFEPRTDLIIIAELIFRLPEFLSRMKNTSESIMVTLALHTNCFNFVIRHKSQVDETETICYLTFIICQVYYSVHLVVCIANIVSLVHTIILLGF